MTQKTPKRFLPGWWILPAVFLGACLWIHIILWGLRHV